MDLTPVWLDDPQRRGGFLTPGERRAYSDLLGDSIVPFWIDATQIETTFLVVASCWT
jgi:hypothetical protein